MLLNSATPQARIIDSGSTNRAAFSINLDESGHVTVEQNGVEPKAIQLSADLCAQLLRDIQSAGTLSALPRKRCMKSASFGSSLFVESNGDRSPDLSCSPQVDSRSVALQKDVQAILQEVNKQIPLMRVRPVRRVGAVNPQ